MKFLSLCSGIEAASVAWLPLGWQCVGMAEIEPFPCAVLKHHYPDVPNYGNILDYEKWPLSKPDVLIGGTPCQSFSVAGLRKGMADPRGNLALTFLGTIERFAPTWVIWENVPGVLSSDQGRAFGAFLGGLAKIGYGFAYTILDAQWFGLAQRRERVFVVGHIGGNWQRAAAVLFDRESLSGHSPPSRQNGQGTAQSIAGSLGSRGNRSHTELDGHGAYIPEPIPINMQAAAKNGVKSPNMLGIGQAGDPAFTVNASDQHAVAYRTSGNCGVMEQGYRTAALNCATDPTQNIIMIPEVAWALQERDSKGSDSSAKGGHFIPSKSSERMAVRRLTPKEAARLQGFPDDYLDIQYRGKPACDDPKYKALGNSMAVPVIVWIGQRIQAVS